MLDLPVKPPATDHGPTAVVHPSQLHHSPDEFEVLPKSVSPCPDSGLPSDLVLVESPRWHDDRLVFSDWGAGEGHFRPRRQARGDHPHRCNTVLPRSAARQAAAGRRRRRSAGPFSRRRSPRTPSLGALSTNPWNDIVSDGRGNTYVNNIGSTFHGEFAPGLIARQAGDSPPSCRRPRFPEWHGSNARQDIDRGRVLRRGADRVRHCTRWRSFQPSGLGRT